MIRSFLVLVAAVPVLGGALLWLVQHLLPGRIAPERVATAPLWPRPDGSMPARPTSYGEVWDHPEPH